MPTFPVDLKDYLGGCARVEQQTFDLAQGLQVQNQTAGGEVLRQRHQLEQFGDPRGALLFRRAKQARHDRDILADAHVGKQTDALERIADAAAQAGSGYGPNKIL